jgi:hypothetical protein
MTARVYVEKTITIIKSCTECGNLSITLNNCTKMSKLVTRKRDVEGYKMKETLKTLKIPIPKWCPLKKAAKRMREKLKG